MRSRVDVRGSDGDNKCDILGGPEPTLIFLPLMSVSTQSQGTSTVFPLSMTFTRPPVHSTRLSPGLLAWLNGLEIRGSLCLFTFGQDP